MNTARLLFPAIRWDATRGFESARTAIDDALQLGVGGFILFGGEAQAVRDLTADLHGRSAHPLLVGADLERGAGQQFQGATPLPPLAAIGSLNDLQVTRQAGELTAREARALGINWVYAPDADVDVEPRNPIVGTRAFGTQPAQVADQVTAWITGCHEGGALACAKHFPGHGRTTVDSHAELPVVDADRATLAQDLVPFQAAIQAGVDSIMSAHISFPALDPSGVAATLSQPILTGLLRKELGFDGLIVTDALIMKGVLDAGAGEETAVVAALDAGCDALLYPTHLQRVASALQQALSSNGRRERVEQSVARIDRFARRMQATHPVASLWGSAQDRAFALGVAMRTVHRVRGDEMLPRNLDVYAVDDDLGGPYPPPSRAVFIDTLRELGVQAQESPDPVAGALVAVYCDIRAWKSRPGLSETSQARVRAAVAQGARAVILFGHPRLATALAGSNVICAWGGEALMQQAAARWLVAHALS